MFIIQLTLFLHFLLKSNIFYVLNSNCVIQFNSAISLLLLIAYWYVVFDLIYQGGTNLWFLTILLLFNLILININYYVYIILHYMTCYYSWLQLKIMSMYLASGLDVMAQHVLWM